MNNNLLALAVGMWLSAKIELNSQIPDYFYASLITRRKLP